MVISHNDLDGVISALVVNKAFEKMKFEGPILTQFLSVDKAQVFVSDNVGKFNFPVTITDLCIDRLPTKNMKNHNGVRKYPYYIDHHPESVKYENELYCYVDTSKAACLNTYNLLKDYFDSDMSNSIFNLVTLADLYDRWESINDDNMLLNLFVEQYGPQIAFQMFMAYPSYKLVTTDDMVGDCFKNLKSTIKYFVETKVKCFDGIPFLISKPGSPNPGSAFNYILNESLNEYKCKVSVSITLSPHTNNNCKLSFRSYKTGMALKVFEELKNRVNSKENGSIRVSGGGGHPDACGAFIISNNFECQDLFVDSVIFHVMEVYNDIEKR